MADWNFACDFRLYAKQPYGKIFQLTTLHSIDATLVTNAGVNQMRVVLYDPGQRLRNLTDAQGRLHPIQAIQLRLNNRHNQWGVAWTGYIDAVHFIFDPQQGDLCQIMCSGPVKLWEITNTSPKSAYDLALAYMRNAASSQLLAYSAEAVGYPTSNLIIDPIVDSGTGFNNMITDVLSNPQAQSWSSIIQALQSNAGIEWFFDEEGKSYWRQVGYLRVPRYGYRPVLEEDVLNADLAEGDTGVVTKVSVRFAVAGAPYSAGPNDTNSPGNVVAEAPASMIQHLRQREVVEYIPWLRSGSDGVPTATFLANFLLQQYSANVITGSITIPADPMFRVGTVCEIPSLRGDGSTMLFYISSIAYALQWNDHWTMTLGLTYGHTKGQNFPYNEAATYPLWTPADAAAYKLNSPSSYALLPTAQDNPTKITTIFQIRQVAGTPKGQVLVDPGWLPIGANVSLALGDGAPVGEQGYTVARGPQNSTPTIQIAPAPGLPTAAYITIIDPSPAASTPTTVDPTLTTTTSPLTTTSPITTTTYTTSPGGRKRGTGSGQSQSGPAPTSPSNPATLAMRALALAYSVRDAPGASHYILGTHGEADANGERHWDCSGLVYWAYCNVVGGRCDFNPPSGPQYYYMQQHGAVPINVNDAQPGDLLFIGPYEHIGFCWRAGGFASGQTYGANNSVDGLRIFDINGYHGESGLPFNLALDMSGVTATS